MTDKRLLTPVKLNLLLAADYIEMYGWHQGDLYDEGYGKSSRREYCFGLRTKLTPRVCAIGAIFMTSTDDSVEAEAVETLAHYIGQGLIGDWNDAENTTQDMVVHALRQAALDG